MRVTETLRTEHLWIEHMLDCLEVLAVGARDRGELDGEAAAELLFLCDTFADGQHQEQEEAVVIPRLMERAGNLDEDELRGLLQEHGLERESMQRLRDDLTQAMRSEPTQLEPFARHALDYVRHHRAHVEHENKMLLPLLERCLTSEDDAQILEAFHHLEGAGHTGPAVFERIRVLCRRLGVQLRVPGAPPPGA